MFLKHDDHPDFLDLSLSVRDTIDWKIGILKDSEFPLDITALAFDPVSCLLAIGTARGVIHLHGGPSVETKLLLPEAVPVRFLQFGLLTERLVCLDSGHHLHIWDLSPVGSPKHMATVRWNPVTFMILSPSHNHILIALTNGEVRTYDLACMRKSPYILPNMWQLYEDQMLKSGLEPITTPNSRQAVELLLHPRDLNLLFIAYEDGVALVDLKDRRAIRHFELLLLPGAPGGGGYNSKDILLPRRPSVTCIAIHPAGHFFAVGHSDGTIGFWALEDPEQPILARTLDSLEVNTVDAEALEMRLSNTTATELPYREPVFKLSWSGFSNSKDPRGGETALTILGGTAQDKGSGLNVLWFPAFNPGDPPGTSPPAHQGGLHPFTATAIRQSLTEINSFHYSTRTPVQDFYLIPRESPHFNNTYDPYAILIISEAGKEERTLESREFPPPSFTSVAPQLSFAKASPPEESTSRDLDLVLETMSLADYPQSSSLPFEFSGSNFMGDVYNMQVVPKEVYPEIVSPMGTTSVKPRIKLSAGCAIVEAPLEGKRTKYQPHRILVCPTKDLTISFYDISGQLQQAPDNSPLLHDFPETIDPLEINLQTVLDVIDSKESVGAADEPTRSIIAAHFAPSTLECTITLNTGELLVYQSKSDLKSQPVNDSAHDPELRLLKHVTVEPWRKLAPYFALGRTEGGKILSVAISEIGFIAAAYSDGALYVIDMRGPTLLHKPTKAGRRFSKSSRHSFGFHHITDTSAEADAVASLTWTIRTDSKLLIRLIAIRSSGNLDVYTISQSRTGFHFEGPITSNKAIPNPLPGGTFVISAKTGAFCKADQRHFADMIRFHEQESEPVILVTSGIKGVRSFVNITGDRIGKAEWSAKFGDVIGVQIVERLGSKAFVAYTDKSAVHVYSLPYLEHIHTIPALATPFRHISIDEGGDFISLNVQGSTGVVQSSTYGTLFNFRRADELPLVDLTSNKGKIPSQPQPVSIGPSSFRSWFQFNQTMTGQQIDELRNLRLLVGGSDRPAPVIRARDVLSQRNLEDSSGDRAAPLTASTTTAQSSIYSRLTTAMNERGQMLGELEENFKSLEQGSKDMLSQAKRLAAQNSAKSWFGF
ncbi:hypothetical protein D9756_005911 [Leucocoprinus leucothites]|uniref:Lethal giant larvae (Lgl)-like C-terminal domain-containing protein n=1 Tax=Leucocoprinus leucothites TaxID=201217 RepID=A0A8H5D424_9AGAR|nr:hypothetical protein D9756_005911 [Leucoagaricus leucothites]